MVEPSTATRSSADTLCPDTSSIIRKAYITNVVDTRIRRRLTAAVKDGLRRVTTEMVSLNRRVVAQLGLRDVDMLCLDLLRRAPHTPTSLARRAGLHAATMTGVLDRLERGGWIVRERAAGDRRAISLRRLPDRNTELIRLYDAMSEAMDEVCADYSEPELELVLNFLRRSARAGEQSASAL